MNCQRLLVLLLAFALSHTAAAQNDGRGTYMQLCATCHGADLTGSSGSNLVDDEWAYGGDRSSIFQVIHDGRPDAGMPPFGEMLSDEQIYDVVDFIVNRGGESAALLPPGPDSLETLDYELQAEIFAEGLEMPWAIDFIDQAMALVIERPGRLRIIENGVLHPEPIVGTPQVLHEGQGGLLDVTVDPDYAETGWIYLSYSHLLPGADSLAMTRIVRGRLQGRTWTDEEVLFEAPHDTYLRTRHHYGSRIVFDPEGYLYFSIGDRGRQAMAQDLSRPNGKVHRIHRDGTLPADNPFLHDERALPSIYSYGHRNPQGMAVHPVTGELWAVEHGPRGGDELNLVLPGRNYGWPVITYGINYDGSIITEERRRPGMMQPITYWRPSIAVSGLDFYRGELFPYWKNQPLVSALSYEEVRVLNLQDDRVLHQEVILDDEGRVREAVTGPDGAIYAVLNEPHMVLRITPRAVQP